MRVLLDTSTYKFAPHGGVLRYVDELTDRLPSEAGVSVDLVPYARPYRVDPDATLPVSVQVVRTGPGDRFVRLPAVAAMRDTLHPLKRLLERKYWQLRYSGYKDTIFHSTYQFPKGLSLPRLPMVATIHDMIYERFKDLFREALWDEARDAKAFVIRNAARYIAISERSKLDLCELASISPDKVDVIYLGVNTREFNPLPLAGEDEFLALIGLNRASYLFYVGGRAGHKNFETLLRAYAASGLRRDISLVVAGSQWSALEQQMLGSLNVLPNVKLVVNPCNRQLAALYRNAAVFVFPSFYEGFGLPVLEAMACGTPVALSNAGPLPEIGGDVAKYFDPRDEDSIIDAIGALVNPEEARLRRKRGLERANLFSWDRTTRMTVESYRKTLGE